MKIELMPGIASMSGTLCKAKDGSRIVFATRKAATTNQNKVRAYFRTADSYKRRTPPSENELKTRGLFANASARMKAMSQDEIEKYRELWRFQLREWRGKKYATLRGFILAHIFDELKKQLNDPSGNIGA